MASSQTTIRRIDSFPFDSAADGCDEDGYPVYDRAVGASVLRTVFRQFFTDGVFGTPADALQIAKGGDLSVTIQPGVFIIQGAMGGVYDDPMTVVLDTSSPQGNMAYAVMLRYDENENEVGHANVGRSLSIRVVKGDAASDPTPPSPDKSTPGVMEYRLGYVVVPSGATDLTGATITNEKGLAICPYAAPFEEIDVDAIVSDFRKRAEGLLATFDAELDTKNLSAQAALAALLEDFDRYRQLIESALDETTAGHLQNQIDDILAQLQGSDLGDSVDGVTIAFSRKPDEVKETLHVISGGINSEHLADSSVTSEKLARGSVLYSSLSDDALDSIAANEVLPVVSDLTLAIYTLHLDALKNSDMDSVIVWEFDQDTTLEVGMWDDEGKKFYCYKGAE